MRRSIRLPAVLLGSALIVLLGLLVTERWTLRADAASWAEIAAEKSRLLETDIVDSFSAFQDEALRSVRTAGASILAAGIDTNSAAGRERLFDLLAKSGIGGLTLEYYDWSGRLLAWSGPRGPDIVPQPLHDGIPQGFPRRRDNLQTSTLIDGPIYSYLVVTSPVFMWDSVIGRIVGKRLFTVNHPVNNRFLSNRAPAGSFQAIIEARTGVRVAFRIRRGQGPGTAAGGADAPVALREAGAESIPAESRLLVPLRNILGEEVGYVVAPRPDRAVHETHILGQFRKWENLAGLIALVLLLLVERRISRSSTHPGATLFAVASVWIVRYALILTDIPGVFFGGELFDPTLFASSFGYGAARSLGDLLLSAIALTVTLVVFHTLTMDTAPEGAMARHRDRGAPRGIAKFIPLTGLAVLIGLLGPLSRGLYAIIQSAVFDSRIDLNDPRLVFPDPPMAVLLLGVFLLVFSSILGGMIFLTGAAKFFRRLRPGSGLTTTWAVVAVLALLGSLLFDVLHPNPLGSPGGRLLMFSSL
ncbi:MAG TPA: hypothetical protein VJO14_03140, partial [Bacteroidota bacterium]|nr:hypothetical protein [Bacteroidota bacterium]